jgi:hypothetical protein
MVRSSFLQTGCSRALAYALVLALSGVSCVTALGQTTGAIAPGATATTPSLPQSQSEGPPPGGCMPIGVTVSGDIVFPFQCKDFIERQKGTKTEPAAEDKRAPSDVKPAPDDNSEAAVQERTPADDSTAAAGKSASAEEKSAVATDKRTEETDKPTAEKSAAVEDKPAAVGEAVVVKPAEDIGKPAPEPVETTPLLRVPLPPRRARFDPSMRHAGPLGCTHFRTYDPDSGTYRSYDGQLRTCR